MLRRPLDWRRIAWIAGGILIVWLIAGIMLAGNEPGNIPTGTPPVTLRGGRVVGNHISTRSWNFDYKKAQMTPDGLEATVDGVRNGVMYRKGKPYLGLSAEHVSINTQTFDFTAVGDVHINEINPKDHLPKSFDTDLVQWNNAAKNLDLPHPTLFRTGDQILKVASITVDFTTNDVHTGKISGSLEAPGK